jgi:hypothetical protein
MTTDHFCFYSQNRRIQTSQTGGQWYSDTSPFSIPCFGELPQPAWVNKSDLFSLSGILSWGGGQGVLSFPSAIFHCVNSFDSIDNEIPGDCTIKVFRVVINFRTVVNWLSWHFRDWRLPKWSTFRLPTCS